ncbi:MAG: tRNA (guanine-N(7)-)-methyltransferase [candidate division KSB1 bacterium]|nr:tRNA (guanine-N(7)-)-methyltransferase [candidate division KSB1 bacterium]
MKGNSKLVISRQTLPHERLEVTVRRHLAAEWQKPPASHTREAFMRFLQVVSSINRPMILDSGCGTGESTLRLAEDHMDCWVIGIDKSAARLAKANKKERPQNAVFLRADQFDFWRLAAEKGMRFKVHYLFYPNPWPKKEHLKRRVHAHPAFKYLIAISERLILRSNWLIFIQEFAAAYRLATGYEGETAKIRPQEAYTLFEKKFLESGHELYEFRG